MSSAVIVDAVRTPLGKGKPGGAYSEIHPVDLHAHALRALVERSGIDPVVVDDVISGAVGQIGEQSGNTARWALLGAGFPESVPGVTVDRQCGSSQQALHFAAQGVIAGAYDVVIASGVESMSRIPIGSQFAGEDFAGSAVGARYESGLVPQGISAELIADRWGSRAGSSTSSPPSRTAVPRARGRTACSTTRSASSTSCAPTRPSAPAPASRACPVCGRRSATSTGSSATRTWTGRSPRATAHRSTTDPRPCWSPASKRLTGSG